jgi:hypothetical protein
MPYSNLFYHLEPITHYAFAFILLFIIVPLLVFKSNYEEIGDKLLSYYMTMVFTIIVIGYLLVIMKLFEFISIVIVFSIMLIMKNWDHFKNMKKRPTISYFLKSLFDFLEGLHFTNGKIIKVWIIVKLGIIREHLKEQFKLTKAIEVILFIIILSIASYIRFFDAIYNAAPPLSDSYVTLAWMKYIDSRVLFHDGIYPQGFHIYLATLFKFSAIDGLYVLRYTGPLNSIFIMLGLYYVIKKFSGNGIGALVAASIYGCFVSFIDWFPIERQVGTNSQEFAFVFIFPALYFLINYCLTNKNQNLYYGMLGTAVIGLVHSFAFVFMGLLIGILLICYLIQMRKISQIIMRLVVCSLLTVVIAIVPIGLGMIFGKELHSSSVDYLLSNNNNNQFYPMLVLVDYTTLACLSINLLLLFNKRITKKERFVILFCVLSGLLTFCIYYFGGTITNSVLVASRSLELWGLMVPFIIGICLSVASKQLSYKKLKVAFFILTISLCTTLLYLKAGPIIGYKLEHNANIEQYLKIRKDMRPKSWLMVSNDEGYSVALGTGFHMHLYDFLHNFDSSKETLTRFGESKPDLSIPPHVFILFEKNIFKVSKDNSIYPLLEPKYKQRETDYIKLVDWLNNHETNDYSVVIYYEDANIIIYYLEGKVARQEQEEAYREM